MIKDELTKVFKDSFKEGLGFYVLNENGVKHIPHEDVVMIKDTAHAAQLQEDWEDQRDQLGLPVYAGETQAEWEAMGFVWHEPNQALCYTHDDTTIYLYDDAEVDVYQDEKGPFKMSAVSFGFIADLIEVIKGN